MADEPWPGALPSGARLGRYQVLQAVHRGSNADLYLATVHGEAGFQKEVALELACEAEPGELLARARAAISLSHANIAAIIDIGELELRGERVPYVVSEWPRGSALDGARAAGDQPLGAVLRLGAEVAKALDHAHRRVPAVTHGRLAARHVFVTEQGTVKVNGFGQPSTGPAALTQDLVALIALLRTLSSGTELPHAALELFTSVERDGGLDAAELSERLLQLSFVASPEPEGRSVAMLARKVLASVAAGASVAPAPQEDAVRDSPQVGKSRFVGRRDELDQLARALARAGEPARGRLYLTGPAGIGKTRLAEELLRRLPREHARGVSVSASAARREGPLAVLTRVVRRIAALPDGRVPSTDVELALRVQGASPDQIEVLSAMMGCAPARSDKPLGMAEAFAGLLQAVAQERPLLIVVDDAEAIDDGSKNVLGSMRDLELSTSLPVLWLFVQRAAPADGSPEIALGELLDDDVAQLLLHNLGARLSPPELFELCVERAGGHPLFVELLARLLVAEAHVEVERGVARLVSVPTAPLGESAEKLSLAVIHGLTEEQRALLAALQVLDGDGEPALLARVAGLTPQAAEAGLEALERAGLGRKDESGKLAVASAYREAAYGAAASRHVELHLAAAELLASSARDGATWARAGEHYQRAGQPESGAAAFAEAARAFDQVGLLEQALLLFARALPGLADPLAASRALDALADLGARTDLAASDLEEGLGHALALADRTLDKSTRILLRCRLAVAFVRERAGVLSHVLLDQAEAESEPTLSAAVVQARLTIAARAREPLRAVEALSAFEGQVRRASTPPLGIWLDAVEVALLAGRSALARTLLEAAPEADATIPDRARVHASFAAVALANHELAEAATMFEKAADLARLGGAQSLLSRISLARGQIELDQSGGDRALAFARLSDAVDHARASNDSASLDLALSELEALERGPAARASIERRAERAQAEGRSHDALRLLAVVARRLYGRDQPALQALAERARSLGLDGLAAAFVA